MGATGSKCLAARIDYRALEKFARGIRAHGLGSAVEKKAGSGLGGGRNSHPDHSQAHGIAGVFGGRYGVSDSFFVIASGDCREAWGARAPAREGEFPDYTEPEAVPHTLFDAGSDIVKIH